VLEGAPFTRPCDRNFDSEVQARLRQTAERQVLSLGRKKSSLSERIAGRCESGEFCGLVLSLLPVIYLDILTASGNLSENL